MQISHRLLLIPLAITLGGFAMQSSPVKAFTLPFSGVYVRTDSTLSDPSSVNHPLDPNYVNILVDVDGVSTDATAGLDSLTGFTYIHNNYDSNNSFVINTDPTVAPFGFTLGSVVNGITIQEGYFKFDDRNGNSFITSETAGGHSDPNYFTPPNPNGIVNNGEFVIKQGTGNFAQATGTLSFVEHGIEGVPYVGQLTVRGNIYNVVPEPLTILGAVTALGLGASLKRRLK
jgi:hypothetical protein